MKQIENILTFAATAALTVGLARGASAAESGASAEGEEPDLRRKVAVLSFDDGAEAGALMETVADELGRAKYDVVAGDRLAEQLEKDQHGEVPKKVASEFAGIADDIGDGVKSFFYKGNETAVEELTPIFDLGMGHPEVLVRRPDFAEQIFQAGIVLIRSHRNLNNDEKAKAVARQVVRTLPGREPSPSTAPPGTIRFFRDQREKLSDRGTKLGVQKVDSDECTAYLNGTEIANSPYVVAPGETYYLRLECGTPGSPVWKASVDEGVHRTVPIASRSPLDYTMQSGDFTDRKHAENYLRLVQFWTDISQVLGVKRKTPGSESNGVLVVRLDPDSQATWSDTTDRGDIRRAISRVMPDYETRTDGDPTRPSEPAAETATGRWLDWTFIGVGGAALAGGAVGTAVTEQRAKQVRCSPDTADAPSDCGSVETIRLRSSSEIEQAEREVSLARVGYIGAYAIGAGLATWGTVRMLGRGSEPKSAATVEHRFVVAPRPDGFGAQFRLRW